MNKKILISILTFDRQPYIDIEKAIRETWGSQGDEDIEIIYYYGGSEEIKLIDDKLFLNTPEGLYNIGRKTLKMYDFILKNFQFDYLFRTNSSSYIDIKKLKEFIKDKPDTKFYSGVIGNHNGINFASGSGYFLSKDLVKLVSNNQNRWNHRFIDDVSLSKILHNFKIKIFPGKRGNLINNNTSNIDLSHYHYRVKTPVNRRGDIKKMNILHKKLGYAN